MMKNKERLFEEFPAVTSEEWIARINADLRGTDFNSKLIWRTDEGFDLMPFYMRTDLKNLRTTGVLKRSSQWLIRQDIVVHDYSVSNRKARDIIERGVESLGFIISDPDSITMDNIKRLLDGIPPDAVEINFLSNGRAREILSFLREVVREMGSDLQELRGAIETDPAGRLMLNGTLCIPPEAGFDYLATLVRDAGSLPRFRVIHINGASFGNAGAGSVQELAFTMSELCEYMSQLTDRDIDPLLAASRIRLGFGAGSDYFMEIAKLRAARLLWPVILEGFIKSDDDLPEPVIHCQTTKWNKTIYDPYVNMLRTQTEAMSALLGGADSITILPFTSATGLADEFGERIARNQQLILREEAFFDRTADPSAGSYYIEFLTNLVAENAWKLFLETEEEGGFISALKKGFIQGKIEESASLRKEQILKGSRVFVGTNHYRDPGERLMTQLKTGDDDFPLEESGGDDFKVRPVRLFRGTEELEKILAGGGLMGAAPEGNGSVES